MRPAASCRQQRSANGAFSVIRNAGGLAYVPQSANGSRRRVDNMCLQERQRSQHYHLAAAARHEGDRSVPHTGCGMLLFTNDILRGKLKTEYPESAAAIDAIDFGPFPELESAVKADVEFLKTHPLVLEGTVITGWIYAVETGKVSRTTDPCALAHRCADHPSRLSTEIASGIVCTSYQ